MIITCAVLNRLDGIATLLADFRIAMNDFKQKGIDSLSLVDREFDTEYLDLNVRVSEIETRLQAFINQSFERMPTILDSIKLLNKFEAVLLVCARLSCCCCYCCYSSDLHA